MQLWKIAKREYTALTKLDIAQQSCPDRLHIANQPKNCFRNLSSEEQCKVATTDGIPIMCIFCWEREL